MKQEEPTLFGLTDAEYLYGMWVAIKLANEKDRSYSGFLSQILDIMIKDKEVKGHINKKHDYYARLINYSWIRGKDKFDTIGFSSIELLIAVKLALYESKKINRGFPYVYEVAVSMIKNEKAVYEGQHKSPK